MEVCRHALKDRSPAVNVARRGFDRRALAAEATVSPHGVKGRHRSAWRDLPFLGAALCGVELALEVISVTVGLARKVVLLVSVLVDVIVSKSCV